MNQNARKTYSVSEVAKLLGIGRNLTYQLVRQGEIKSLKLGEKRIVIPKAAVEQLLNDKVC